MGLMSYLGGRYRHFRRYNQIAAILLKYGFEDAVSYMDESKRLRFLRKLLPKRTYERSIHLSKWEKIRLACEELGPTFVKFAQIISNRPDLLPAELVNELEKLQDKVPPVPGAQAVGVLEKELNKPVSELFQSFETQAFASASMAQVHKAVLNTGEKVVLKIQRPGIREVIEDDIKIMYYLAEVFEKRMPSIRNLDPTGLIRNFEESIKKELDFIHESINIQRFTLNYTEGHDKEQYTFAPKVYQEFTTSRVLCMEFISGVKISDTVRLQEIGADRKLLGSRLVRTYFKQVFEHGFFHADPHPGNILILPGNTIYFLDFGMMGNMLKKDLEDLGSLILAVLGQDTRKIILAIENLTDTSLLKDNREFEADLYEFVNNYHVHNVHKNELSTMLMELRDIALKHGLKMPSQFYLLARSLVTIEGAGRQLDADLDILKIARPFMVRSLARHYNPIKFGKRIFNAIYEMGAYLEEFPGDLKNAMHKINKGEIKVELEHKGVDSFKHTFNRISRQIVNAVIIGSLFIASSLLINAGMPPKWNNISVFGIIGLVVALLMSFSLVLDLRKGDSA